MGSILALLIGVAEFRWFFLGATLLGAVLAFVLFEWHRAHPEPPARERAIALHLFDGMGPGDGARPPGPIRRG